MQQDGFGDGRNLAAASDSSRPRRTTVNRPLAAFGALMTFLVLAMFAVSSTGRSTSVQAVRPAKRLAMAQLRRVGPKDVHVASTGKTLRAIGRSAGQEIEGISRLTGQCEARSCGLVMAERYLTSLTSLQVAGTKQAELATVQIVAATDALATWRVPEPMACLSYCDAEYDRIVYGIAKESKTEEPKEQALEGVEIEELVAIFSGLVDARGRQAAAGGQKVGTAHSKIDWAEYAELIDRAIRGAALTAETAKTSGSGESVRSGDWLRHSAALSLYRVGALLQAAALEVEHAGGNSASWTAEGMAR
jgi:hypothetical protein